MRRPSLRRPRRRLRLLGAGAGSPCQLVLGVSQLMEANLKGWKHSRAQQHSSTAQCTCTDAATPFSAAHESESELVMELAEAFRTSEAEAITGDGVQERAPDQAGFCAREPGHPATWLCMRRGSGTGTGRTGCIRYQLRQSRPGLGSPRLRQECIATATTRSFLSEKTWALRWFMEFMGVAFVRSFFVHFVLQVKTPTRTATDAAGTPTGRCCLCLRAKVASKPKDAWGLLEACKYKCESMES